MQINVQREKKRDYSKQVVADIRILLWVVTLGGLALSYLCIRNGYLGSLPWLTAMVGLPWTAHGYAAGQYLSLAKSDHSVGGITYEAAKAANFGQAVTVTTTTTATADSLASPPI